MNGGWCCWLELSQHPQQHLVCNNYHFKSFLPHLAEDYVSFFHHLMSFVRRKLALLNLF
jgi:hypothetical protein